MNLVTSPPVIFFTASKTVCNLDFIFANHDNRVVFLHVILSGFHSEKFDKSESSRLSFKQKAVSACSRNGTFGNWETRYVFLCLG